MLFQIPVLVNVYCLLKIVPCPRLFAMSSVISFLNELSLNDLDDAGENGNISSSNGLHLTGENIGMTSSASSQHSSFSSLATVASGKGDARNSGNEKNWDELPSIIIENIYSFLSRPDQSRMSLVCSRWANEFKAPSLWKTMKFIIFEHGNYSETCPEVKFARKYGSMFRHVEINCPKDIETYCPRLVDICKQLTIFLQVIESSSQLISVKFIDMTRLFVFDDYLDDVLFEALVESIISFFNSQENLVTVAFQKSYLTKEGGMELLMAIFHSKRSTIRNLSLKGFLCNRLAVAESSREYDANLLKVCSNIGIIETLEVDYTHIFEDAINFLYQQLSSGEYQLPKMEPSFTIYCKDTHDVSFRGISPEAWKYMANTFPAMKVKMVVTIENNLNREMEKFFVKEIPLQVLEFWMVRSSRIDINALFTHFEICKYHDHLEKLNICWKSSIADFSRSVVSFIQSCKKLQTFYFNAKHTPMELENALKAFLENHPVSLKAMTWWFDYLQSDQDENNLLELSQKYQKLFEKQGIKFFLVTDKTRRAQRHE